jgi:hypothetical protein
MFYAFFDEEQGKLLSMHAVSSDELPFKLENGNGFSEPIVKIGFFSSAPVFVTPSINQMHILIRDRIVKTSAGVGDILLLDKYIKVENLKIVQFFSGLRVLGEDTIVHPISPERDRV